MFRFHRNLQCVESLNSRAERNESWAWTQGARILVSPVSETCRVTLGKSWHVWLHTFKKEKRGYVWLGFFFGVGGSFIAPELRDWMICILCCDCAMENRVRGWSLTILQNEGSPQIVFFVISGYPLKTSNWDMSSSMAFSITLWTSAQLSSPFFRKFEFFF